MISPSYGWARQSSTIMDYRIDATNKILGRLASDIALKLRGKNVPQFDPAKPETNLVTVFNTDKIRYTGSRKGTQKTYYRHSGYPGALKAETLEHLMARDSRLVLKQAILGMLPKNKLRRNIIKNLKLAKREI